MPNKGDKVRAILEGEYSHQGGFNSVTGTATGFHIIKVGGWEVAVPPDTDIQVTEKYEPPEPPCRSVVVFNNGASPWPRIFKHDGCCTSLFRRDHWASLQSTVRFTWQEILNATDNGRSLKVYLPADRLV